MAEKQLRLAPFVRNVLSAVVVSAGSHFYVWHLVKCFSCINKWHASGWISGVDCTVKVSSDGQLTLGWCPWWRFQTRAAAGGKLWEWEQLEVPAGKDTKLGLKIFQTDQVTMGTSNRLNNESLFRKLRAYYFLLLTSQVLFIHAITGGLHGHLQHPDTSVIRGQHDLIWCAPVNVKDAVVHVATDPHAADHLDLNTKKKKNSVRFHTFANKTFLLELK